MDDDTLDFIDSCRRAVLATIAADGRPRLVPICFAVARAPAMPTVYTPLDEKPKRGEDVRTLARVRDVIARPGVTLLFDRWSEDWSALAWVRLDGAATILEPVGLSAAEHEMAVGLLRARYPQYLAQAIDRLPMIRIQVRGHRRWSATTADPASPSGAKPKLER